MVRRAAGPRQARAGVGLISATAAPSPASRRTVAMCRSRCTAGFTGPTRSPRWFAAASRSRHGERQAVEARWLAAARLRRPAGHHLEDHLAQPEEGLAHRRPARLAVADAQQRDAQLFLHGRHRAIEVRREDDDVVDPGHAERAVPSGGVAPDGAGPTSVGSPSTSATAAPDPSSSAHDLSPGRPSAGSTRSCTDPSQPRPVGVERNPGCPPGLRIGGDPQLDQARHTPASTPSCQVKKARRPPARRPACGAACPDAVAGPALLVQEDRTLVLDTTLADWSGAAILRACSGSTRLSPSAVVRSTAG